MTGVQTCALPICHYVIYDDFGIDHICTPSGWIMLGFPKNLCEIRESTKTIFAFAFHFFICIFAFALESFSILHLQICIYRFALALSNQIKRASGLISIWLLFCLFLSHIFFNDLIWEESHCQLLNQSVFII